MSFTQSYSSFTYRLPDGSIPHYQGIVGVDSIWISVGNLTIQDVPWTILSEGRLYDDPEFGLAKAFIDKTNDPIAILNQPAYLSATSWWRAYQPTYRSPGKHWFQADSRWTVCPDRDIDKDELFSFAPQLKADIIKDCSALRDDLAAIRKLKAFPVLAPLPLFPSFESLDQGFSYQSFTMEYCKYLCYLRGGMGVFNWWRLRTALYNSSERWWYFLPDTTIQRVRSWNLESQIARGVLLNLTIDRHRVDVNLLVHSEIGFAYPWTMSTRKDSRFLRWCPVYLARIVRFVRERNKRGRFLLEDEMAQDIGIDVRTVTAYDTTLSEIQVVPESMNIPFDIIKREGGVTNAYFALVNGWDPLPVETNLEWNELAKYFQVVMSSRSDVNGPVYTAQALRPFGNLLLPTGEARREFSRIFSPVEFMSAYWTPQRYIQWFDVGVYRSNLVVRTPDVHLEPSLADSPYYPSPEFDDLLFNNLLPDNHRRRLETLRRLEIARLKQKSGHSSQFTSRSLDTTEPIDLAHISTAGASLEDILKEDTPKPPGLRKWVGKSMIVRTRKGVEQKQGPVKDNVANRLIWGTIGSIVREKRPNKGDEAKRSINESDIPDEAVQPESSSKGNEGSETHANPIPAIVSSHYRVGNKDVTAKLAAFGVQYYPSLHQWRLTEHVIVAPSLIAKGIFSTSLAGEIAIKVWLSRAIAPLTAGTILLAMIEHGIPLYLGGATEDLAILRPLQSATTLVDLPLFLKTRNLSLDYPFVHHEGPQCGVEFLNLLNQMDQVEGSVNLLGAGGAMNFVIRTYLPNLVQTFFQGVPLYGGRFQADSTGTVWLAEPDVNFIRLALGFRHVEEGDEGRSIFPLPEWIRPDPKKDNRTNRFKEFPLWTPGYWEPRFFESLRIIATSIEKKEARARSRTQWRQFFRGHKGSEIPWYQIEDEAERLCASTFNGRWNRRGVSSVTEELMIEMKN